MQQGSESVGWEQGRASWGWQGITGNCIGLSPPLFSWDELAVGPPLQLQPHPDIRFTALFGTGSSFLLHPQPPPDTGGWFPVDAVSTTGLQETLQSLSNGSQRHGLQRQMSAAAVASFKSLSWSSLPSSCWWFIWSTGWIWKLRWLSGSLTARVRAADTISDSTSSESLIRFPTASALSSVEIKFC